jgi:hypothetical protein
LSAYKNEVNDGTDVGQVEFLSRINKNQQRRNTCQDRNQPRKDGSLDRGQ